MVQFLSIIFFRGFLQFLLGFSKVPVFFCVTCILLEIKEYMQLSELDTSTASCFCENKVGTFAACYSGNKRAKRLSGLTYD